MPKPLTRTKAILHPIRARLLVALQGRQLTPRQIAAFLEDVPLTTLYRHLNLLLATGLIRVCAQHRGQGGVERVFTVVETATLLTEEDRASLTAEDILGLVGALSGIVQEAFGRYVRVAPLPPKEGEVAFLARSLFLSDDDYQSLRQHLVAVLQRASPPTVGEGQTRRLIAFFSTPDFEPEPPEKISDNPA